MKNKQIIKDKKKSLSCCIKVEQLKMIKYFQYLFNKNRSQIINDALSFFFEKLNDRDLQHKKFEKIFFRDEENAEI